MLKVCITLTQNTNLICFCLGVNVCVYGNNKKFPDFFTQDSGFEAPNNVDCPIKAAEMIKALGDLGLDTGMLIAVPIPEEHESDGKIIKEAIGLYRLTNYLCFYAEITDRLSFINYVIYYMTQNLVKLFFMQFINIYFLTLKF